jgi:hypothetical protein
VRLQGTFGYLGQVFGRDNLIGIDIVSIYKKGGAAEFFHFKLLYDRLVVPISS